MLDAEAYFAAHSLSEKAHMVLQIHDELIFEIAEDAVDAVVPALKTVMERALPDSLRDGVPIVAEASVGKRWSEMKKFSG
jgi:DNA polymerase-1